ncbi:predicted protein [Postia placenta Mad-698-R]|nr:predicted protein [Postia placenta Mad-698-R]
MGILGIGVDVLHVPRILELIKRRTAARLAARILIRFSVKEAAYKALYPVAKPAWKELTFHGLQRGVDGRKPTLEFHPSMPSGQVGKLHASVSHDGEYVFTTVLVEESGCKA